MDSVRAQLDRFLRYKDAHPNQSRAILYIFVALFLFLFLLYFFIVRPPSHFPTRAIVSVEEGTTLAQLAGQLEAENVVRSGEWLRIAVSVLGAEKTIQAGDYYFDTPESLFSIASRLARADFGLEPIRVQILEGATADEMAKLLEAQFVEFDPVFFRSIGTELEGYLFPDTYFLLPNLTAERAIKIFQENFFRQVGTIRPQIEASGRSLTDIVIMASLLEREAQLFEVKQGIAGVLWNRIDIDMPLQVDAVFRYINGKGTFELTQDDLASENPYNTYRFKGLPPGPIGNPSLESLLAAAEPIESDYFYYLADRNGVTHFSETFVEHKRKKAIYLD